MKIYFQVFVILVLLLSLSINGFAQSGKDALSFSFTPSVGSRLLHVEDRGNFQRRIINGNPETTKRFWDSAESAVFTYSASAKYVRQLNTDFAIAAGIGFMKMGKKHKTIMMSGYYETTEGQLIPIYSSKTTNLYSDIKYLYFPVCINYQKSLKNKLSLIANAGVSPMYAISWRSQFVSVSFSGPPNQDPNSKDYFMTVSRFALCTELALGMSYKLSERIELQLTPNYFQQLTPGVTFWEDLYQYHYNLGLQVGTKLIL
ncbi:MAG: hypothetical protein ACXWEY_05465 [Bacteroidia bacterium]